MTDKAMSQIFEDAAEAIETKGWHRGSLGDPEIGMCALGALNYVSTGHSHTWCHNYIDLYLSRKLLSTGQGESVAAWNDQQGQTREVVIDTLMACAKDLRNEGR